MIQYDLNLTTETINPSWKSQIKESEGFFFSLDNKKGFAEPDKSPPGGDFFLLFFFKDWLLSRFQDSFNLQFCANCSTDLLIKKPIDYSKVQNVQVCELHP